MTSQLRRLALDEFPQIAPTCIKANTEIQKRRRNDRNEPSTLLELCHRAVINLIFGKIYTEKQVDTALARLNPIWSAVEINSFWYKMALCSPIQGCGWLYPYSYFDCSLINSPLTNKEKDLIFQGICVHCKGERVCHKIGFTVKEYPEYKPLLSPEQLPEEYLSPVPSVVPMPKSPLPLPDPKSFPEYPGGCGHHLIKVDLTAGIKDLVDMPRLWEEHIVKTPKKHRRIFTDSQDDSLQDIPVMSPLN